MSDFLRESISDWKKLLRSVILIVVFIFILSISFYLVIKLLTNDISSILTTKIDEITIENGIPTVRLKRETLRVVVVSAQQIGVDSGIILNKDKTIDITAQGLVSTGHFLPDKLLPDELQIPPQNINDLSRRVFLLEADRDLNTGWRNPDGDLMNNIWEEYESSETCISKNSKAIKLDKDAEWGSLMGFIKTDKEEIKEIISSERERIFKIGKKSQISYDKESGNYVVKYSEEELGNKIKVPFYGVGKLFFIINDSLVEKKDNFDYPGCELTDFEKKWIETRKKIYDRMKDIKAGIYYLDNQGNFIVSILTKKK